MRWTEAQQARLQAMGLRLWWPSAAQRDLPDLARAPKAPLAAAATAVPAPRPLAAEVAAARPAPSAAPASAAALPAAMSVPAAVVTDGQVAGLDWSALRARVAGCQDCRLCERRRQAVFGSGHLRAHCMVVGDAPDEAEDLAGEPFVGEAGQLLDRMLAALGLSRSQGPPEQQVFIANALKCRSPRNRKPSPEELAACQPYLQRQVALVQPRVIIAMGRSAVQSLLGSDEHIDRLRGRVHEWQGRPLVVSYHPAYLLRQPADKAKAWDDLCRAAMLLRGQGG